MDKIITAIGRKSWRRPRKYRGIVRLSAKSGSASSVRKGVAGDGNRTHVSRLAEHNESSSYARCGSRAIHV
jgi:hypothetical protein